jgi:cell division protein ZapA (FtsZ GTPase activity inhibitor)
MENREKTSVRVEIYGKTYTLVGSADTPADHIQRVAQMVDSQMKKIAKNQPALDVPRVAVLAAVNLADELQRALQERDQSADRFSDDLKTLEEQKRELEERLHAEQQKNRELESKLAEMARTPAREEAESLRRDYARLEEEYRKLQSEFNEWIQLVESESERPE